MKTLLALLLCKALHRRSWVYDLTQQFGMKCDLCGRTWTIRGCLVDYDKWLQAKFLPLIQAEIRRLEQGL